jgi:hypothetical protein
MANQLITEARQRFGQVEAISVPQPLWEQVMDEVADAGGAVGFDHCMVDGVRVEAMAEAGEETARVRQLGAEHDQPLSVASD